LSGADLEGALFLLDGQVAFAHEDQLVGTEPTVWMATLTAGDEQTPVVGLDRQPRRYIQNVSFHPV
jgi:hypothetical protein